jgi:hypothetical protein
MHATEAHHGGFMTLEQLAYLGNITAAIGVIVSLFYVARQIGQSTDMMRAAASSGRVERDYQIVGPVIENRQVAEMWEKADKGFTELDAVDQIRMLFFERKAIGLWYHDFQLHERGLLPDADWHEHVWIIQNIGRRQSVRAAWQTFRGSYEPAFQNFMDRQFAIADADASHTAA